MSAGIEETVQIPRLLLLLLLKLLLLPLLLLLLLQQQRLRNSRSHSLQREMLPAAQTSRNSNCMRCSSSSSSKLLPHAEVA